MINFVSENESFDLAQDIELGVGDTFEQFKTTFKVTNIHPVFIEVEEMA